MTPDTTSSPPSRGLDLRCDLGLLGRLITAQSPLAGTLKPHSQPPAAQSVARSRAAFHWVVPPALQWPSESVGPKPGPAAPPLPSSRWMLR